MKIINLILFSALMTTNSWGGAVAIEKYFNDKAACFILYDLNQNKLITEYNPERCKERIPPNSTFKIALSLMAFDQNLINQATVFKWDNKEREMPLFNGDQTPATWLANSVVWVSQVLTPQLGLAKIQNYLKQFNYGNQDFSGDPGKNNALTRAWLSSSLRISGDEQFRFLKNLIMHKLPISQAAMDATKTNMYLETLPNGWKLYGKTGSGNNIDQPSAQREILQNGWFIGYVEKDKQTFLFVLNFSDLKNPNTSDSAGKRAKAITKELLERAEVL